MKKIIVAVMFLSLGASQALATDMAKLMADAKGDGLGSAAATAEGVSVSVPRVVQSDNHSKDFHRALELLKGLSIYAGLVLRFRPYWTLLPSVKLTVRPSLPDCTACVSPASTA